MAGKRVAPSENGKEKSSRAGWVIAIAAALLVVAAAGLCRYANTYPGVFPGVTADGGTLALGGLSRNEAEALLEEKLAARLDATGYRVELEGAEITLLSAAEAGYAVDTAAMAEQAFAAGREGNPLISGLAFAKGLLGMGEDIPVMLQRDEEALRAAVDAIAAMVDRPAIDGSYELTREGLYATKHQDGIAVDREALYASFAELTLGAMTTVSCPVTVTPGTPLNTDELAARLNAEPAPARYDIPSGKVVEGTVGVALEAEAARYVLEAVAEGERVRLPAEVTYPKMTAAELEAVLFRDLLGSNTTTVTGTKERRGNVKLAGELVNGTVLNDGDIFDYNKIVGERTVERGFGAAASYVNGETVDTVGGGICQVSSTVYLSALLSNLEIVERYNHRYWPGYITLGMDATVSWGGPEFRFKNNTGYPIRIEVIYENNKLTVNFYGTRTDDTYVKMTREVLSTTGYETEYEETEELPWGTQKEKQNGYTGYKVESYRNVYAGDGTLISRTLEDVSNYKNRNEIILVGIAGKPADGQTPGGTEAEPVPPPAGDLPLPPGM